MPANNANVPELIGSAGGFSSVGGRRSFKVEAKRHADNLRREAAELDALVAELPEDLSLAADTALWSMFYRQGR